MWVVRIEDRKAELFVTEALAYERVSQYMEELEISSDSWVVSEVLATIVIRKISF